MPIKRRERPSIKRDTSKIPKKDKTPKRKIKKPSGTAPVDMVPVSSSNIDSIGYDTDRQKLYVKFIGSGTYEYSSVPEYVYNDLLNADSVGKYFHANIRKTYSYQKI